MNENKDNLTIKSICLAVQGYASIEGDIMKILIGSIIWLYDNYQKMNDKKCLYAAKLIIEAYMQFGLLPAKNTELFHRIYAELGEVFEEKYYSKSNENKIKANITQIRRALGKWPKAYRTEESSDWVARNILEHIKSKDYGSFFYECQRIQLIFELLVTNEGSYLIDTAKGKIYVIIENEESDKSRV